MSGPIGAEAASGGTSSLAQAVRQRADVRANRCYQCGKCSAGCPLAVEMDIPPTQVMRLLQVSGAGAGDRLLRSLSIWLCLSCETCFVRCPMEIDIPAVMDVLRQEALARRTVHPRGRKILAFHKSFLDTIHYTGRLFEMGMTLDYKLRTGALLQDLLIAPVMFFKGKLHLLPERIRQRALMRRVFRRLARRNRP